MSLTQTYMLAHIARGKLSKEAAKPDHDLRRLVGHANMLDNMMLDLANAEQEQEAWFNNTVSNASKVSQEPKHVQWADTIPEEVVDEAEDSDSDSEDEEYETAQEMPVHKVSRIPKPTAALLDDEDEEMEDDDDYEDNLALTRTSSHTSSAQPPELMLEDSDSDSDDDMPPSPPAASLQFDAFSEKQRQAIATTSFYQSDKSIPQSEEESFFDQDLQTAITVY